MTSRRIAMHRTPCMASARLREVKSVLPVTFLNPLEKKIIMQSETLKVKGMTCDGCTSKVAHALNAIAGVHEVVVSLSEGEAAVRYNEHLTTRHELKSAIKAAGYGVHGAKTAHKSQGKGGCCG